MSGITIETIEDGAAFEALRPEWNALLEDSVSNGFFLTWEWLHAWWKHLAGRRRPSILALRRGGELVAVAPFALNAPLGPLAPFRTLEFLGTGSACSDHLDLIVRRGSEPEAMAALGERLSRRKLMVKLVHLDRGSSLAAQLAARLRPEGWSASEASLFPCPFIDLTGHSWASYLATLDAKNRGDIQRRLRKLDKEFDVRFEPVVTPDQRRRALELLFALHEKRWQVRGGSGAFHTQALRAFHEEASQAALDRGWLRLFVLWLDGKPAGARYGFRYGRTYYSYQSGFDPSYGRLGIGLITLALAIKTAIAEGAGEYDMLAGSERYKFRLAHEARELGRLELYPPGPRWSVYRRALGLKRVAGGMARRMFTPAPTAAPAEGLGGPEPSVVHGA